MRRDAMTLTIHTGSVTKIFNNQAWGPKFYPPILSPRKSQEKEQICDLIFEDKDVGRSM